MMSETRGITKASTGLKKTIRNRYEPLHPNECDSLDEMYQSLVGQVAKTNSRRNKHMNKEMESLLKSVLQIKF